MNTLVVGSPVENFSMEKKLDNLSFNKLVSTLCRNCTLNATLSG